jgi:hypothetical protein
MPQWLDDFADWLKEVLLWIPRKLWELVLDGLATLIEAIPVPTFMENLGDLFAGLSPAIGYFVQPLEVETGISFIIIASIIRFAIRRIPVVG